MEAIKYLTFLFPLVFFSCSKETTTDSSSRFVKYYHGSAKDEAHGVALCSDGGYVLAGTLLTSDLVSHAFVLKTDDAGNETRLTTLFASDTFNTSGNKVVVDNSGNFLVVGTIEKAATAKDFLLAKISPAGDVVWTKTFGGTADDEGLCILSLASGGILVGGSTKSYGYGGTDFWVMELTTDGTLVWSKPYGFSGNDVCNHLLEADDYYLLTGSTENVTTTPYRKESFLVKINKTSGGVAASVRYGGDGSREGVKTVMDSEKNLYVLCNSQVSGISNILVMKLKNDFYQKVWEKNLASITNQTGTDLLLTDSKVFVSGYNETSTDFDYLVNLLDSDGNVSTLSWFDMKSKGSQMSYGAVLSQEGFLTLAGATQTGGFSEIALIKTDNLK